MKDEPQYSSFLSTFTVNILFVMLIIVGAAMIPLLSLQLNPTRYLPSLTITWSWPEAPVRVVEQEVTSVLEGVLGTVTGVKKISSTTNNGSGRITVEFDRNTDLRAKRFEVASLIRESRKRLPDRVSYPVISMNMPSNETGTTILSLQVNGNASSSYIYTLAEEMIKPAIAVIEGVYSVNIYGATPREWEIIYDQKKLSALGIITSSINSAVNSYLLEAEVGGAAETFTGGYTKRTYITLKGNNSDSFTWDNIPVAMASGRIIHLSDVAQVKLKEQQPQSFYRINGLNTVNMNVSAGKNVNTIRVAGEVKNVLRNIRSELPPGYSIRISADNTVYLKEEISKNIFRALLSVVLLLMFVLLVSREFRYLLIIAISLIANIFIAFIFYYLFKLEIHLYSLAGITVSFGIIINNTIVMTDHIRYHRNRKVGISLLAATLTTIGALVVIFFLDEASKVTLSDFAAVVIINLSVSLAVALFFIPSLLTKIKLSPKFSAVIIGRKRRIVRVTQYYLRSIGFIIKHRTIFIIAAVLVFGLPVFYLPDSLPKVRDSQLKDEDLTKLQMIYNKTLGNRKYVQDIKPVVNKAFGGTFRLFSERARNSRFYYYRSSDEAQRTRLTVNIGLSEEGLTIHDLNTTCMGLENMLASYDEIDMFTTSIRGAEDATVTITFKPEHDFTIFPFILKIRIEDYMNGIGSYHASVYGVGKAFSNQVYSDYLRTTYSVIMKGYNYDELYGYAEGLRERLIVSGKGRIKDVYLLGAPPDGYIMGRATRRTYRNRLGMDKYYLAGAGSDIAQAFSEARSYSKSTYPFLTAFINGVAAPVSIKSLQAEEYDYWSFNNIPLPTRDAAFVRLKDFSSVNREITDNAISREDQQYLVTVGYDFIGNYELGRIILQRNVDETNAALPLGYRAETASYTFSWNQKQTNYYLIFLVILIIYFICSILLESFSQPFVVISLIPFSFIGVFVTFHLFRITPDEGVFAALILLCGIVVNATLYILNDYNSLRRRKPLLDKRIAYMKAFNGKIIPIFLTMLAIIVGLIPFLLTGRDERFWFALAAGTISGLLFSMIGLFVYQPLMLPKESRAGRAGLAGRASRKE
ncbi:MAG: efflux RND transporter permease subunit [Bacteroidales bacterium]|nr:efflux RND transporter permease subunit [Bacteroidales bacterium]